jgi:ergothioneine biosynthesis protein EgtB
MKRVSRSDIIRRYQTIRAFTQQLCKPLEIEDFVVQSMPDVSPTKWHLAHTSWFFETFLLKPELSGYQTPNELYNYLFNSYYNAIGGQFPRPQRGLLSRPTVAQVFEYRQHVDQEMHRLLESLNETKLAELGPFIELGLNHEQQHQELMLTDLKHVLFQNPLYPAYSSLPSQGQNQNVQTLNWISYPGGKSKAGFAGSGFSFDNETPEHEVLTQAFELADRLVTNGEYLAFIEDNGYTQSQLWLSDGWALINKENWQAPLYWVKQEGRWFEFTLNGLQPLDRDAPVSHISYYEADAYANWSGARLPSEFEWEIAAQGVEIEGNFVETGRLHPVPASASSEKGPHQMYGDVWEWTRSPYVPFPGFKAATGAVGEYNGKFMSSQMILKGGSCVSSKNHLRASYRNFFYPHSRWQFMGLRLAKDIDK